MADGTLRKCYWAASYKYQSICEVLKDIKKVIRYRVWPFISQHLHRLYIFYLAHAHG
jgi:hypothetical protein